MSALDYPEALEALDRALAFGINPSLAGIRDLCMQLGHPESAGRFVQVTGTNGKTSTSRLTEALLRAEGLRTGLYTSPELERYPERIEVDGVVVPDAEFAEAVSAAVRAADELRPGVQGSEEGFTEFELLTAAALWIFRKRRVEVAVLEVGLGGRWDATSVVAPTVAVITGVGLDHTSILGDTLEEIAAEKAAIIRGGAVAVLGPGIRGLEPIFAARAAEVEARTLRVGDRGLVDDPVPDVGFRVTSAPRSPLDLTEVAVNGTWAEYEDLAIRGAAYQGANIATAVAAAEALLGRALDTPRARAALLGTALPGRFEVVRDNPIVIVDGSHNPQAAKVLSDAIVQAWPSPKERPMVLLGVLADKDAEGIVAALAPAVSGFIVTAPESPRALSVAALSGIVRGVTGESPGELPHLAAGVGALAAGLSGPLVITGSLTTAGQARRALRDAQATDYRR